MTESIVSCGAGNGEKDSCTNCLSVHLLEKNKRCRISCKVACVIAIAIHQKHTHFFIVT